VGPLAFVGSWALAGASTAGYSTVDDAISDLAAVGAPTRAAMTAGFVVFGLGVVAFGAALRDALDGRAGLACVVTATCTLGVAATPLGGWSGDTVHAVFAGLGYASLAAAPLLAARPFARRGRHGWARASRVAAIASALCLVASTLGPAHGLWQRLGLSVGDVWIVVTALALLSSRGPFTDIAWSRSES
jgi:hypothetical membrane protein